MNYFLSIGICCKHSCLRVHTPEVSLCFPLPLILTYVFTRVSLNKARERGQWGTVEKVKHRNSGLPTWFLNPTHKTSISGRPSFGLITVSFTWGCLSIHQALPNPCDPVKSPSQGLTHSASNFSFAEVITLVSIPLFRSFFVAANLLH